MGGGCRTNQANKKDDIFHHVFVSPDKVLCKDGGGEKSLLIFIQASRVKMNILQLQLAAMLLF